MKDFIQLLKLPPSILSSIAMGTAFILFLPDNIMQRLGLENIPDLWRTILGMTFIISVSLLGVYLSIKVFKTIKLKYYLKQFQRKFPKVMKELRSEELFVVTLIYMSPNYTSRLPYTDGVTTRLASKRVIQLTSKNNLAYGDNLLIPYTITPIAQDYIDKHLELIEGINKIEVENFYRQLNDPYY